MELVNMISVNGQALWSVLNSFALRPCIKNSITRIEDIADIYLRGEISQQY